jgi:transcriptional regulator with GAF, ATPase, and Fis domain
MRRRSRAGGKSAKWQRRKTLKHRNAPKTKHSRDVSVAGQESSVARLTRERDEALKQQTAASEVLRVISSSPGDLEAVFRSILVNANRICEALFGTIFRYDGNALVVTAWEGVPPEYLALLQSEPLPVNERTATGRAVKSKKVVHIADLSAELPRTKGDQLRARLVELGVVRTILAVPMLKEGQLIGAISIYRQEVRPFTDKQIELVKNFAAQSVIWLQRSEYLRIRAHHGPIPVDFAEWPIGRGCAYVRFWHKADISRLSSNVRFGGKADMR